MDLFDNLNSKTKCLCITITSAVLLTTILVAASFSAVEPTEYGILYNKITKQIDKENI